MGWDKHKLLWDGTDKYVLWITLIKVLTAVSKLNTDTFAKII